eukprot:327286_1
MGLRLQNALFWMRDTIQPWKIKSKKQYAKFVLSYVKREQKWQVSAESYRQSVKAILGNERESRYMYMIVDNGELWLLYSYELGSTIKDVFGTTGLEHKNKR